MNPNKLTLTPLEGALIMEFHEPTTCKRSDNEAMC